MKKKEVNLTIQVPEQIAKWYLQATPRQRQQATLLLGEIILPTPPKKQANELINLVYQIQEKAKKRGLRKEDANSLFGDESAHLI